MPQTISKRRKNEAFCPLPFLKGVGRSAYGRIGSSRANGLSNCLIIQAKNLEIGSEMSYGKNMILSRLVVENFRIFGSRAAQKHLDLPIRPGLTVLVGENDGGKTTILDALRLVLGTTSQDYMRLHEEDFHKEGGEVAEQLSISLKFSGLSEAEQSRFAEWLTIVPDAPTLDLTFRAQRVLHETPAGAKRIVIQYSTRTGSTGEGKAVDGDIRSFLRLTYLKALRDAEQEMAAGRGSRLAQLLLNHPSLVGQGEPSDLPQPVDGKQIGPPTLKGVMEVAEQWILDSPSIGAAKKQLNEEYLSALSVGHEALWGEITIGRSTDLKAILEKLELWLTSQSATQHTRHGLGLNNLLFMAAELLLLSESASIGLPLLLVEEPEAHLHPQMQLRLMEFLETKTQVNVQAIVTTHSPVLASKSDVENLVYISRGSAFPMCSDATELAPGDYRFLRRFLDSTKSNLFFAKGVVIVEGDAENILLPVIAELLGRSFSKFGVSVVNVGHVGLFRYSTIFQRKSGPQMNIPVACIADRDIPPDEAKDLVGERKTQRDFADGTKLEKHLIRLRKHDGGPVKTFVSEQWTLEFDLALAGMPRLLNKAVVSATLLKEGSSQPDPAKIEEAGIAFEVETASMTKQEVAVKAYEKLYLKDVSKTETAQQFAQLLIDLKPTPERLRKKLPKYLLDAIDYVTGHSDSEASDTDSSKTGI